MKAIYKTGDLKKMVIAQLKYTRSLDPEKPYTIEVEGVRVGHPTADFTIVVTQEDPEESPLDNHFKEAETSIDRLLNTAGAPVAMEMVPQVLRNLKSAVEAMIEDMQEDPELPPSIPPED